jgi:hypothetical protein
MSFAVANSRPLRALPAAGDEDEGQHQVEATPTFPTRRPQQGDIEAATADARSYLFRSIQESDRGRIQELHEEWFPVV